MNNPKKSYYLDSNFLIQIHAPNHDLYKVSIKKMYELLKEKALLYISCLAIDETLYSLYKTWEEQVPEKDKKPFNFYYNDFKRIIDSFKKHPLIKLVQFENDLNQGLDFMLEAIKNYNLRPHDAFHYAIMRDCRLSEIVTTNKKHFGRIGSISVVSY